MPDFYSNMTRTVVIRSTIVMLGLIASICHAADSYVFNFANGAKIRFSSALSPKEQEQFNFGWKKAEYISKNGKRIQLLKKESFRSSRDGIYGVLFSNETPYPPNVSPDNEYVILDVIKIETVEPYPGKQEIQTKQYCPVMEIKSGCILYKATGDVCAGDWKDQGHHWSSWLEDDKDGENIVNRVIRFGC